MAPKQSYLRSCQFPCILDQVFLHRQLAYSQSLIPHSPYPIFVEVLIWILLPPLPFSKIELIPLQRQLKPAAPAAKTKNAKTPKSRSPRASSAWAPGSIMIASRPGCGGTGTYCTSFLGWEETSFYTPLQVGSGMHNYTNHLVQGMHHPQAHLQYQRIYRRGG